MRSKEPAKKRTSPAVSRSLNWRELSCGKRLPREESIENGHHSRETAVQAKNEKCAEDVF